MRNLIEYPITAEEVEQTIRNELALERSARTIGGVHGVIWSAILDAIKHQDVMDIILGEANESTARYR